MNVPKLRFKEFNDEWQNYKVEEILKISNGINKEKEFFGSGTPIINYMDVNKNELISHNIVKGLVIANSKELETFNVKKGDILFTRTSETSDEIGLSSSVIENIDKCIFSGFILKGTQTKQFIHPYFGGYYFRNPKMRKEIIKHSSITTRALTSGSLLSQMSISIPTIIEQEKIGKTLSLLDKKIELQTKKIEDLKLFKLYIRNKIFSGIKTKDKIINTLNYEQPNRYIVKSDDYLNDENLIPVLTANKAFILGYCNEDDYYNKGDVIIFDDFTMDSKYVNFNFKIKSSAIKLLTQKNNNNLKYIFECLQALNLESTEHKRHYISIIQEIEIPVPDIIVQNKIANLMFMYDKKIKLESDNYSKLIELKKGLMQNMFV